MEIADLDLLITSLVWIVSYDCKGRHKKLRQTACGIWNYFIGEPLIKAQKPSIVASSFTSLATF